MKGLRYWIAGICIWFFFLYNIERLGNPINLATFVYIFALVCAVLIILLPVFQRVSSYWLFLIAMPPFFLLKTQLGYPIAGSNLPITVTEICAIGLTIATSGQIAWRLRELQKGVAQLTVARLVKGTHPFDAGQGQIYREIRRARRYQRPAALLAVSATEESLQASLNRFIEEAQQALMQEYTAARIGNLLVEELQDSDVVTRRNNHFVTLLPETNQETAQEIVKHLQAAARDRLGLTFKVGIATFPDEAVTFESLLEQAETRMHHTTPSNGKEETVPGQGERVLLT